MTKLVRPLTGKVEKLACLLARWHSKLNNWHAFGTLARLHVKMRSWHTFGKLARGRVDHTGTHGTHGMRFSKLEKR